MARPVKNNADYFSHDNDMRDDERIKAVRRKFSHIGYSTWNMLLERLCRAENFKIEYQENNLDIMAGDFSIEPSQLKEIINYLIFLKLIIQEGQFIYSQTMITRFEGLFKKRKRETDKLSSTITQTERVIADDNTQSKVNNSIVNESKENKSKEKGDVEKPPILSNDFSEEKNHSEKKEIIFASCVEPCKIIFLQSSPDYAWAQRDTEQLLQLLQKIIQTKKSIQAEDELIKSFSMLLQKLPEYWRTKKFTLPHLNANYNEIVSEIGASGLTTQAKNTPQIKINIPQPITKPEPTAEDKIQTRILFINSICEAYDKFKTTGSHGYLPLHVMYDTLVAEKVLILTPKQIAQFTLQATDKRKAELKKPKHAHETKTFHAILENFNEEMKKGIEKIRIDSEVKTLAVQGLFDELKKKNATIKNLFKN